MLAQALIEYSALASLVAFLQGVAATTEDFLTTLDSRFLLVIGLIIAGWLGLRASRRA